MQTIVKYAVAMLLMLAVVARAEPTTMPTTAPTTVAIDDSTPRGTLKKLVQAMDNGDGAAIRSILHSENPREERMAGSMASLAEAFAKIRTAAIGAYGAEKAATVTGDSNERTAAQMAKIDSAVETPTSENVVVTFSEAAPSDRPITLKNFDGHWKILVSGMSQGLEPAMVDEMLDALKNETLAINETAADIAAGKFQTVEEAAAGLRGRIMRAAMQGSAQATSRPSADPATQPAK